MSTMWTRVEQSISELKELISLVPSLDLTDLTPFLDAAWHADSINDRYLLLERALVIMSRLGNSDIKNEKLKKISATLQEYTIDLLYKDLPHPPASYLAPLPDLPHPPVNKVHEYRTADGSSYNPLFPTTGMAGAPYARSVPPLNTMPTAQLPDAGLVFDTLLARDKYVEHPGGISSLFFAYADLIIHTIFNTDPHNWEVNRASSYMDLSILYGNNDKEVDRVRRKDGTGRLWDDVFADYRLVFMPKACAAILVLLCRNHNYIADKIFSINERGNFRPVKDLTPEQKLSQDEEIFDRSRLVNCGFFMQIILRDYVGAILGLGRDGSDWRLDPLMEMRKASHDIAPRGEGNAVSIEFNLMYRWHSTLSQPDTAWTEAMFKKLFAGKDLKKVTFEDFHHAARSALVPPADIRKWTFHGLDRDTNGRFKDSELAKIIQDATETRASAFKARGIPTALRIIEILGIEQSRSWGTCTLNEFRKFIGLKPFTSFEEWNSDTEIARAAESLYHDVNNLELHVGLQAEEAKQAGPGAGLCPGYTVSRAILADAVCLTRGDRYLTVEYTPFNLTSWGYLDCHCDKDDGAYGGMMTKLLFRTLPDFYPRTSAYAHFPFMDPKFMKKHLESSGKQALASKYDWRRPALPRPTHIIATQREAAHIIGSPTVYASAADQRLQAIIGGEIPEYVSEVQDVLATNASALGDSFAKWTKELLKQNAYGPPADSSKFVDIVKDVINILPARWICNEIAGLPLTGPKDVYKYKSGFANVAEYTFANIDPTNDWALRERSSTIYRTFFDNVKQHLDHQGSWLNAAASRLSTEHPSHKFFRQLVDGRADSDKAQLARAIFCEVVPTATLFSHIIAIAFEYYLDEAKADARKEIIRLGKSTVPADQERVCDYIYRSLAANPPISGVSRVAMKDDILPDSTRISTAERVYVDLRSAYSNVVEGDAKLLLSQQGLLHPDLFQSIAPKVLTTLLSLQNITPGAGRTGQFNDFTQDISISTETEPTAQRSYLNSLGRVTPWPDSLVVQFTSAT